MIKGPPRLRSAVRVYDVVIMVGRADAAHAAHHADN